MAKKPAKYTNELVDNTLINSTPKGERHAGRPTQSDKEAILRKTEELLAEYDRIHANDPIDPRSSKIGTKECMWKGKKTIKNSLSKEELDRIESEKAAEREEKMKEYLAKRDAWKGEGQSEEDNQTLSSRSESGEETVELNRPVLNINLSKTGRKRTDFLIQANPGDHAAYLAHAMKMWKWNKVDMTDDEAVEQRVIDYFMLCAEDDMKPSVAGLGVAFGVDRRQINRWHVGEARRYLSPIFSKAYALINAMMEQYMLGNKINPASAIFIMKNNFDYHDEVKWTVSNESPLGDIETEANLLEGVKQLPD